MNRAYRTLPAAPQPALGGDPFHLWETPSGGRWLEFHRQGPDVLLRFPGFADFLVPRNGAEIACTPVPGVSEDTVQHLYLNQVLPLAHQAQGGLAVHGSAVAIGGKAVAFIGSSGQGKSTLAASFASHGQPFLTDDGLLLTRHYGAYAAVPSHPSIRLWSDSEAELVPAMAATALPLGYSPKSRFLAGEGLPHCRETLPLAAIYVLGGGGRCERVSISALKPAAAVLELARYSFHLDIEDRRRLNRHFDDVTLLCQSVPVFELDYPRRYGELDQVREAVLAHVDGIELRP